MSDDPRPAEHVMANREHWDATADDWVAAGERAWRREPSWGIWGVPEEELRLLPGDMSGMRAVELGCGTGYVSAWMARRGAVVTGLDASERQLATARRLALEHGVDVTFLHGDAERTPFGDEAFDFAVSEYGAAIWCDPHVWIPEAHRILAPGGRLVFLGNHPLVTVCSPWDGDLLGERLVRPYFGMHRTDWRDVPIEPGGVEFNLTFEGWFALFRDVGFVVEDVREPRPSAGGTERVFFTTADWGLKWPTELVWRLRKPVSPEAPSA